LAAVISAWPGLLEAVRSRIVGLVEGALARDSKPDTGNQTADGQDSGGIVAMVKEA